MADERGGRNGFDHDGGEWLDANDEYDPQHEEPQHGETTSPLADEAVRLMASVQDWARRNFDSSPDGHTGSDCTWCPLCQFVAVLRGDRPEVTERVAEAGTAVVSALRAMIEAAAGAAAASTASRPAPADTAGQHRQSAPPPRVQKITLDDPS